MTFETPPAVPPPGGTPNDSPLRTSIARAAASVSLAESPPPAPAPTANRTRRCSKKVGVVVGALGGGIALAAIADQEVSRSGYGHDQLVWVGAIAGAGVGAVLGYEACGG